jgi:hypothetical protein
MDRLPYRELEEGHDPADRPTMGSMWCQRQVSITDISIFRKVGVEETFNV